MRSTRRRTSAPSAAAIVAGALAALVYAVIIVFWVVAGVTRPNPADVVAVLRPLLSPTNSAPITVLALSAIVAFATLGRLPRVRAVRGTLAVSVLLVSAGAVAFATYLPCDDDESPFWTALRRALDLVRGELDQPFEVGHTCEGAVPLGLQAAELMMIIAFALIAYRAIGLVFARQLDRFRVVRARRIVVFTGLTADTAAFAAARVDSTPGSVLPVVLHDPGDRRASAHAETLGGVALPIEVTDADAVQRFVSGRHRTSISGVHLLDPDSAVNLAALDAFRSALPTRSSTAIPNRIQVRIDDPWYADDWRRRHIASGAGWLLDAISAVEIAARAVVAELVADGVDTLVITGASQFELAVLSEFALRSRASAAVTGIRPDPLALIAIGDEAERATGHLEHQVERFGTAMTGLSHPVRATTLDEAMSRSRRAVVLVDPSTTTVEEARNPSFLSTRRPRWRIYAWSSGAGSGIERTIADLRVVHPTLDPGPDGADLWERFGRIAHERYLALYHDGAPVEGDPARGRWHEDLSTFTRESNIRSFSALVASMPLLGRRWTTTADAGDVPGLELADAEVETLAIAEHESWVRHHVEHGWRYASTRDDARRRHPSMRPWSDLPESEREKDRSTVRTTATLLRTLGFTMELEHDPADARS